MSLAYPGGGGGSSTPIDDTTSGVREGHGVVTLTYAVTPCGTLFTDVGETDPFCTEIEWLHDQGISTGFDDGTFRPTTGVSRAAMAAFMYRLAGADCCTPPVEATFDDVPTTHPFFTEIEWVADVGVAEGYGDGTYRPAAGVTRQAMAAFLARLAGVPDPEPPPSASFVDVSTSHPFFAEIEWLVAEDIANGFDDDTFRPASPVPWAWRWSRPSLLAADGDLIRHDPEKLAEAVLGLTEDRNTDGRRTGTDGTDGPQEG